MKAKDYYPITTRTTPEGDVQEFITPEDLKSYTKPVDYPKLMEYLYGSAMYIQGHYITDVEGWLNKRKNWG